MNKYWMIGTKADTYIKKFIDLAENGLEIGNEFFVNQESNTRYCLVKKNGLTFDVFSSPSTLNQYIEVWAALGFIIKRKINYVVNTSLQNRDELIELSKIYITKNSDDVHTQRYRNTIIINTLYHSQKIKWVDIENKNIYQTKGQIKIESLKKLISTYEISLASDENFLGKIKEKYDQQF